MLVLNRHGELEWRDLPFKFWNYFIMTRARIKLLFFWPEVAAFSLKLQEKKLKLALNSTKVYKRWCFRSKNVKFGQICVMY